jgi:hypothetical protein
VIDTDRTIVGVVSELGLSTTRRQPDGGPQLAKLAKLAISRSSWQ